METETTNRTVIEIHRATHARLRTTAKRAGLSVKQFATVALDYAMQKMESGELTIVETTLKEEGAQ